jgi:DNA-binding NtrC family response regulator
VLLPISSDKATEMESPREFFPLSELNPETDTQGTATILVIDDEESVLELCSQLLQLSGWNVITAVNGKEGLAKAEQFGNQISCVLLDVVMPEMGANELLNEFEKRKIQIPTVIMSGFSQTKLEFFLDRPNVVSIVQKPFHAMEIQQAVKEAALAPHNGQGFPTSVATNSFSAFPEHAK